MGCSGGGGDTWDTSSMTSSLIVKREIVTGTAGRMKARKIVSTIKGRRRFYFRPIKTLLENSGRQNNLVFFRKIRLLFPCYHHCVGFFSLQIFLSLLFGLQPPFETNRLVHLYKATLANAFSHSSTHFPKQRKMSTKTLNIHFSMYRL